MIVLILFMVRDLVWKGKSRKSGRSGGEQDVQVQDNHGEIIDNELLSHTYVVQVAQPTPSTPAPPPPKTTAEKEKQNKILRNEMESS